MQQRLGFPHGRAGRAARGQQTLLQQHGQIPRLSLGRMNKEGENKNNGEEKKRFPGLFTKQVLYDVSCGVFKFGIALHG